MFDVPKPHHAGKRQAIHGQNSHEGGEKIAHEINGSFFFMSYLSCPPICPKAITPSRSSVGSETETANRYQRS